MVMTVILTGAVVLVFIYGTRAFYAGNDRAGLRESLTQALEVMAIDLRRASSVDTFSASSIKFTANLGSGAVQYRFYAYQLAGDTTYSILRSLGADADGVGAVLASGLTSSSIFTRTGNLVTIAVSTLKNGQAVNMRTAVFLREL